MARDGAARSCHYSAQTRVRWNKSLYSDSASNVDLLSLNAHRAKDDPGKIIAAPRPGAGAVHRYRPPARRGDLRGAGAEPELPRPAEVRGGRPGQLRGARTLER